MNIAYHANPTMEDFHASDALYRGVMGPVRSGKSTGMCFEIMSRAFEQAAGPDGFRHSLWVIVRNTYRELEDTTLRTWLRCFPEQYFGPMNRNTMTHHVTYKDVRMDVLFRALDRPDDIKKVLSLEVTGAWVNEAREVPKSIIDALGDRVGQYPTPEMGGCTWRGVMMDTNPPDEDHWWYRLAEEERPAGWEFWRQPGGLIEREGQFAPNPDAENVGNLNEQDYYVTRMGGKSPDYVRVYYCGQYGFVKDGKPIYPEYVDAVHCSPEIIQPSQGLPIAVGLDFGLTPAAAFGQRMPNGRYVWFDELVTEDMGIVRFSELLLSKLNRDYQGFKVEFIKGDPSGDIRAQTDEQTPFIILRAKGIEAEPTHTNDPVVRREAVAGPLSRMVDGKPGLIISPRCKILRKAMAGGYCYKRLQVAGDEKYHDKPDKNRFSHVAEAAQYLMLGFGEGRTVLGQDQGKPRRSVSSIMAGTRMRSGW